MTSQPALTELNQKFTQWSSQIEQNKQELEEELNRWKGYKEDYDALGKQLESLADETTRPAMVPFGSLAFMPGKLIHTNEIMVYLGDQYYVERSTKQALGILNRRKEAVNENLGLVKAQWNALQTKATATSNSKNLFPSSEGVNEEGLPIMEIREEVDDASVDMVTSKDTPTASSSSAPISSAAASPPPPPPTTATTTTAPSNDLMAMLDALEQEEEEEEREKQQQLMEQQLTFDIEDDGRNDIDYDGEDLDDLYDTEVADTMFDHFEDDEEYATQGVVEQEDATTHEEEEEEPIKDVVAERPEQDAQVTLPSPSPPASAIQQSEPPAQSPTEKKLSKFKQQQLEKQQQHQQTDTPTEDQSKKPVITNKMPKFKVQKPAERKRKQPQSPSPPAIASSSSVSPTSSTLPSTSDKMPARTPPVTSSKSVESTENQQQQQPSAPAKKMSKFKQFQEQQRQGSTTNTGTNTTKATKGNTIQSKGTPITVPSKYTVAAKKNDGTLQPESISTGKKKVSFGVTTSVREHDIMASPQSDPQGVYSQPLKQEAPESSSNSLQHTIRSPSDIFRVVKRHQPKLEEDGYPILEEDSGINDTVDLRDLATTIQDSEPMFRPNYDVNEDQLPTLHPWRKPTGAPSSLVQSKSKMDTNTMRGAVLEREAENLDLDQVEDDMDFKEIKSSYQRQRQNMLATMGGLSFEPKPEFEVYDEDLPLPSKDDKKSINKNNEEEVVVMDLPKKMSRFKAARMGLASTTEQ